MLCLSFKLIEELTTMLTKMKQILFLFFFFLFRGNEKPRRFSREMKHCDGGQVLSKKLKKYITNQTLKQWQVLA